MMIRKFEWDPAKAATNLAKHGISFELATRIFTDPFAVIEQDRIEGWEQRWRAIGMVNFSALIVVAHTVQDDSGVEVIRIISARYAEPKERRHYEHENGDI
jgi:uncharacterized DUF497 family protein